ncbi:MAG: HAD family hydrolase [Deltaproteobacteria bacterium]|nr:MAG: HAD family hydrolase [Deltaproteobacteria bacterium]
MKFGMPPAARPGPLRAVVFDLFDTLVDEDRERLPEADVLGNRVRSTHPMLHAAIAERADVAFDTFARALREVDRSVRDAIFHEGRELPTRARFERLVERLALSDPDLPGILTEVHMGGLRSAVVCLPHHADVLAALRRRFRIGLCSNFSHAATARAVLEDVGLLRHFDGLAISEDVGLRKPRREIFEAILTGLGVEPGETLHVGDNLVADVSGAAALGIHTAWITRRVRDPDAVLSGHDGPPPAWIIRDLAELPERLGCAEPGLAVEEPPGIG